MVMILLAAVVVLVAAAAVAVAVREARSARAAADTLLLAAEHAHEQAEALSAAPEAWLESVMARRLHVHTTRSQTFVGNLAEVTPDGLVLSVVELVDGKQTIALGGCTFIPRGEVAFVQADG